MSMHIHAWSQSIFPKIHMNYKDKNGNFSVETPGPITGNQGIKVNIIDDQASWYHVSLDMMHWEDITSIVSFPKMHSLNLIMSKHQTNLSLGTFYKICHLCFSKVSRAWETRKDWQTFSNWRRLYMLCGILLIFNRINFILIYFNNNRINNLIMLVLLRRETGDIWKRSIVQLNGIVPDINRTISEIWINIRPVIT